MQWEEEDFQKKWDFGLWKRLMKYAKPFRGDFVLLALIMVTVGSLDAVFPLMTRAAVDQFMTPRVTTGLVTFALGYFGLAVTQALLCWLLIWQAGRIEQGLIHDLRKAGFARLQALSFSYYDRTPGGWILSRLTSDANRLGETISWGLVDMVWGASLMVAIVTAMVVLEWRLALVTLVVVPPLAWASVWFQRKMLAWYRQTKKLGSELSAAFSEGIQGARSTKVLGREDGNTDEFRYKAGRLRDAAVKSAWFSALYLPVVLTLGSLGTVLALGFGTPMTVAGVLSVGTLVAFVAYTVQFFEPVRELARVLGELQQAQTSAERLLRLVETEPEIVDEPGAEVASGDHGRVEGRVTFDHVGFRYGDGPWILRDFCLEVAPGTSVALVGETGSGKSTIVNLLCRFYEPTEGRVLVDGVDYRRRTQHWLQSRLGYVLQTPQLFRGTVRDNIRYGRLDATDAEVEAAADLASAGPFIRDLEHGFDTDVGEGGSRLSTGQKQLVSLARAVLADPALFILDEATSSVDGETEKLIQDAVDVVLKGRTSFMIAHRLSTVRRADRILLLDAGRVVEDGTHDELMALRGRYFGLYTEQFLDEEEKALLDEA
jgi:ATP-binding cassette subfamily B protein